MAGQPGASAYGNAAFFAQLLGKAVAANASDIHLRVGAPPSARIRGDLVAFRTDPLRASDTEAIARLVLSDPAKLAKLSELLEHDTAYVVPNVGRFRVNVYRQRGTLAIVLRAIASTIPTMESLGLPATCVQLAERGRGLVLVVGAAGNGKSSTLASMIGHLNATQPLHIVTIEDPIEFLHEDRKASVSQREVQIDTGSFADALRSALRQDPDVILVGEIRDEVTMDVALQAAETGHLVMSTLHTPDVTRTMGRAVSLAPRRAGASEDMRERLASCLQGIVAQRLLPSKSGDGLVLLAEVLVASGTVREAIRRPDNNPSLRELMEKGAHPYGMQTFDMHARELVASGRISREAASEAAVF
ncbi:MAG: PilT/PilU family type 4a pilus ATPase [Myxococcales bacterium]|nr:PilT/PilU family type 4a pilus ATPase [Myxococcales bacterium]HQY63931.1 PilT/PilU family type 4a pilus ATPase [Polyangiaceae bacterium]